MWTNQTNSKNPAARRWQRHPLTLIELVIASALTLLAAGGIYQSMLIGKSISNLNAQHIAAMSLCQDKLESLRGQARETKVVKFDCLTPKADAGAEEETGVVLTQTEGGETSNILCTRLTDVYSMEAVGGEINVKTNNGKRCGWEYLAPGVLNSNYNGIGNGGKNNRLYWQKGSEDMGRVHNLAKYVVVTVTWEYRGRTQVQMLEGIIYNYDL